MDSRYGTPHVHRTEAEWLEAARKVLLAVLDVHYAVTVQELQARASDRVFDPHVDANSIDPHHFTNARAELQAEGLIVPTTVVTKGGASITTWSRPPTRGLKRRIEDAAQRKRLLSARHNGWSERGGAGRGLIGRAGEDALHAALMHPNSAVSKVTGTTTNVLGVDLHRPGLGEIDNFGYYIDESNHADPKLIACLFENKNTRQWYYPHDEDLARFLWKAAVVQADQSGRLILPVFICRRVNKQLWDRGLEDGFLPARVHNQFVLPDYELTQQSFDEVVEGLGYADLILGNEPNNRLLGIARSSIPRWALQKAQLWRIHHVDWLPPGYQPPRPRARARPLRPDEII